MNTDAFQKAAEAEGYKIDEPNSLSPNKHNAEHTHPFDAMVIVLEGEITIGCAGADTTYGPGDSCTMAAETPHTETVGSEGVTLLVARR